MDLTVGIDEVGRGSWAGPVVVAAVLLRQPIVGLTDSKVLTRKQRERLTQEIILNSYYGVGWVHHKDIDELGLTESISRAMEVALTYIKNSYDHIIIDGNYNFLPLNNKVRTVIKADLYHASVSAASILAKVSRDTFMQQQAVKYPGYGFESNVGYGTAKHMDAIRLRGICDIHRRSFKPIKSYI